MKDNHFESQDAFDEANAAEWRDLLMAEWSRPFVSLTSAVYFAASNGKPIEPKDDALEKAAREIVRRLQDGKIVAYGKRAYYDAFQAISFDEICSATLDGAPFLEPPHLDAALHLVWAVIPGGDDDRIESRSVVRWSAVSIRRADLAGLLPLAIVEPAQGRGEAVASEAHQSRRGRPPEKLETVIDAMIARGLDIERMKEDEMEWTFGASRKTCRRARREAMRKIRS